MRWQAADIRQSSSADDPNVVLNAGGSARLALSRGGYRPLWLDRGAVKRRRHGVIAADPGDRHENEEKLKGTEKSHVKHRTQEGQPEPRRGGLFIDCSQE
jgi:hypothetical protein